MDTLSLTSQYDAQIAEGLALAELERTVADELEQEARQRDQWARELREDAAKNQMTVEFLRATHPGPRWPDPPPLFQFERPASA